MLTCVNCNNTWSREATRGRKPKLCVDCRGTTTTTAVRKEATAEEVKTRLDNLDSALRANNSHLTQQPVERRVYSLYELDNRLVAVEQAIQELKESIWTSGRT